MGQQYIVQFCRQRVRGSVYLHEEQENLDEENEIGRPFFPSLSCLGCFTYLCLAQ